MHEPPLAKLVLTPMRGLGGLIALYESNYLRLLRLVPEIHLMEGTTVSRVAGALDLYLTVLDRFKYTSTIALTYQFRENGEVIAEPDAQIRIYHDARAVEILSHVRRRRTSPPRRWRPGHMPELDRKWALNRFLYKWLGFCQRQGHLFLGCTAIPAERPFSPRASQTLL